MGSRPSSHYRGTAALAPPAEKGSSARSWRRPAPGRANAFSPARSTARPSARDHPARRPPDSLPSSPCLGRETAARHAGRACCVPRWRRPGPGVASAFSPARNTARAAAKGHRALAEPGPGARQALPPFLPCPATARPALAARRVVFAPGLPVRAQVPANLSSLAISGPHATI